MAESNNKVFVDSNFFIALYNSSDALYKDAILLSQRIKKENPHLFISNYIFLEIVTVLSQRVNRNAAVNLGLSLINDQQIEIIHIDEHLNTSTWKIFQEINKKNISFVDCSILAAMRFKEIKKFLTFDKKDFINLRKSYRFSLYF